MCCSALIETLSESKEPCVKYPSEPHTLSVGDMIKLGHKFPQKELRVLLGSDWKAEVKRIKDEYARSKGE